MMELVNTEKAGEEQVRYFEFSPLRRSAAFGKVIAAIGQARRSFKPIKKDRTNPFYKSKYADLEQVIDATALPLAECGAVVVQAPSTTIVDGRIRSVMITTLLAHSSGEWLESDLVMPADKDDKLNAQTLGSAITYAKRYAMLAMLNVSAEDDDDGNAAVSGGATTVKMPQKKAALSTEPLAKDKPGKAELPAEFQKHPLTFAQKFWADAKKTGKTEEQVRNYLGSEGYTSTGEVPPQHQERLLDWAAGK